MKCRSCKREIPENSIFCNWCGEKQIKPKKKKEDISVPKPRQLKSGMWNIELRAEGASITEATEELCIAKAKAVRAGFVEQKKKQHGKTLDKAIEEYCSIHSAVLSPSTIYGYNAIRKTHFRSFMDKDIFSVSNWQKAINEDAAKYQPKTVKNAWGLVARVLRYNKVPVPEVTLPQIVKKELPWISYDQLGKFLEAAKDQPGEFAALLALHSLRRSELLAVTPSKIVDGNIIVEGSVVVGPESALVEKDTNKNISSRRVVPIMIPRLQELIDQSTIAPNEHYVPEHPNGVTPKIHRICDKAGIPRVGLHGLRRSFASLAYHLGWSERKTMEIGGWSDYHTMHNIYIKLSAAEIREASDTMRLFYEQKA